MSEEDPLNVKGTRQPSGSIVYGPYTQSGGSIIEFGPDGRLIAIFMGEESLRSMKKAQTKQLGNRGGLTKHTFEETPLLTALRNLARSERLEKNPEEMRRLFEGAHPAIIEALSDIMTAQDTGQAGSKLDKFVSTLKGARRLNKYDDGELVGPNLFFACVQNLCIERGRIPTKGEIAERLEKTTSHVSKLCRENGFDWLPNMKPGRR